MVDRPGPSGRAGGPAGQAELADALRHHLDAHGRVPAGVVTRLVAERGWSGRLVDVLAVLTEDAELMAYLAGGRSPDEVALWTAVWAATPLSAGQIRLVATAGGWDPEPFVVLASAGRLESTLRSPDGAVRLVGGERVGAWISDELATATGAEVLEAVAAAIGGAGEPAAAEADER